MILAVASGKGGTGKTLISVNLASLLGHGGLLLDCDVEEPNDQLFIKGKADGESEVSIPLPVVDEDLCDGCGECGHFCEYNAIVSFGTTPLVFSDLCHGCGGCIKICPKNAITERPKRIGVIQEFHSDDVTLIQGCLDVGSHMATPIIRSLRHHQRIDSINIIDAPPGTSCPVIASIQGADLVILVTEPTPFGLHDLKLAVELVRTLKIPFGVVINRVGCGDDRVHRFCNDEGISIFCEIPDDRRIAEAYSKGQIVIDALPEYRILFEELSETTMSIMSTKSL